MDELNEAYLDRLVSKMESQFENLSEFERFEYVRRIKDGLNKVLDNSFYKYFKDGYREMGNNYIDRNVLKEIASEYRVVMEHIDELGQIETGEDKLNLVKELEIKLKETSFYETVVKEYDEETVKANGWTMITIYLQPLRGMGIFEISISFNNYNSVQGLDNIIPSWDYKQKIEDYDAEKSGDEYIKDGMGQTTSVKSSDMGWDKETPLV